MKKIVIAGLSAVAAAVAIAAVAVGTSGPSVQAVPSGQPEKPVKVAQGHPPGIAKKVQANAQPAVCNDCGTVQEVRKEKRKGEGGAVGIVAGAAAGGLLGNQIGKGNGKTLATVGGAVAGGFAGNEVQKMVTAKEVFVTTVKMKDGTLRTFEQEQQPAWKAGQLVKVNGTGIAAVAS